MTMTFDTLLITVPSFYHTDLLIQIDGYFSLASNCTIKKICLLVNAFERSLVC